MAQYSYLHRIGLLTLGFVHVDNIETCTLVYNLYTLGVTCYLHVSKSKQKARNNNKLSIKANPLHMYLDTITWTTLQLPEKQLLLFLACIVFPLHCCTIHRVTGFVLSSISFFKTIARPSVIATHYKNCYINTLRVSCQLWSSKLLISYNKNIDKYYHLYYALSKLNKNLVFQLMS